jgi:hypothetical protein
LKILEEAYAGNQLTLKLESPAGSHRKLPLRRNGIVAGKVRVEGAQLDGDAITVNFPAGEGYTSQQVVIRW